MIESSVGSSSAARAKAPVVAGADHGELEIGNRHALAVAKIKELEACGHHSRSLFAQGHLREKLE